MKLIKGSIITKIIISLVVATTVPFIISNYLSYHITGNAIKRQLVELNQNSMSITMSALQSYFHELSLLGLTYFSDPELVRLLSEKKPQNPAESVYIEQRLEKIYANYSEIGAVSYKSALTNKQFNIRNHYNDIVIIPDFKDHEISYAHSELKQPFQVTLKNREPRLRINKPFIDIYTREVIGLTTFDVKPLQISNMLTSLTTSEQGPVYLFIGNNLDLLYTTADEMESTSDPSLSKGDQQPTHQETVQKTREPWLVELYQRLHTPHLLTDKGELQTNEGSYVYFSKTDENGSIMTIVSFIPRTLINKARTSALGKTVLIQAISIVFVSILAAFISYYMLRRIKIMLRHIKKLQMGNFQLKRKPVQTTPDELDLLEIRLFEMADELDELWNKQYRHQLELSQARLKMLQAQINPHFFYNTLQSIGTLAIKSKAHDVSDRLAEFAAMFRYSMDIENEDVTLEEEIEHIQHYMVLQQGRYKQRLQFELEYPNEASCIYVPKMTLQPLVENSIIHGLERGNGQIHIIVSIVLTKCSLLIEVIDNGKGFTDQQIEQVKAGYLEQVVVSEKRGIGLSNVLKRLMLYYGNGFNWSISSSPYKKTIVALSLPIEASREGQEDEVINRR
ncbi:sensor histidine kinase [Paenibacillus sp. FJAT-27812]|uniref:sensor histidine kinase n=1 Tax=Paenibacillus sp. FJAT-27812 TaxID=1684143 RepID=UPI0006A76DA4|nr:histidine kinase [Paenibacillus sp. FJAT-27812]